MLDKFTKGKIDMTDKQIAKTTSASTVVPTSELKPIKTKHLAAKFGMKATALRRVLRTMPEYADGVHTNYAWAERDPMIDKIVAKLQDLKRRKEEAEAAAKAALAKREAEAKAAASVKV